MTWLTDPKVFLKVIIALFALSAIRFAFAKEWSQAGYSACAALLNVFVITGEK